MTKMNFKKHAAAALGFIFAFGAVSPVFAQATTTPPRGGKENFCTRIAATAAQIDQRYSQRQLSLEARRSARRTSLAERRERYAEKRAELRKKWETKRAEMIGKLEEKAGTDARQRALTKFKTAMAAAEAARKAAVDAVQKAFREGLDKLIAERKAAEDALVKAFRATVRAAFQKAKDDCAGGADPAAVRETLKASLEAAKKKFQEDRKALEPIGAKVKDLVEARKAAYKKALDDFKAAAEKARADLKAAFEAARESATTAPETP
jgi:hypothetical protein